MERKKIVKNNFAKLSSNFSSAETRLDLFLIFPTHPPNYPKTLFAKHEEEKNV